MKNIYKIYNQVYDKQFQRFFKFLNDLDEEYNEIDYLPDHLKDIFLAHKKDIDRVISSLDTLNYITKLIKYEELFNVIKPAKINGLTYKALSTVEKNQTILSNLKQFRPIRGHSKKVTFDNASNISGRLIVKEGPNILVLPKRCRNIFESRFIEGQVLSLDFVNLEPRLCLKLVGKNIKGDIYDEINNILEFDIDRSVIKRAIISTLYGANYESFKNIIASKAKKLFEVIHEFFNLELLHEISSNIDDIDVRRNFFGRPIWNLNEKKKNIVINNYVQSSAVDISLSYFYELVNKVDLDKAVPIFIIHDAFVFDIEKDYISKFNDIVMKGYNDIDLGNFPVSISQFNTTYD
jgi:hypothetical protein